MNKIIRLLVLAELVLLTSVVNAAGDKINMAIRSSMSVPFGKYASNEINSGSFTQVGLSFGVDAKWFIKEKFGLIIDFDQSFHPVDASGLADAMVAADPFLTDINVRSESYSMTTISLGVCSSFSISDKFSVGPKILAGIMFGKTPFQLFEPTYYLVDLQYFKKTSSRDAGLALRAGVSMVYNFNDFVAVDINADFTYSKLKFGFTKSSELSYKEKDIMFMNVGLGLIIKLW